MKWPLQNVDIDQKAHIRAFSMLQYGNSALFPQGVPGGVFPHCQFPAAPDDWCRNPAQHISSICANVPSTHAALNILNIYCKGGRGKATQCGGKHATGRKIISPGAEVGSISGGVLEQWSTRTRQQISRKQSRLVEALILHCGKH